MKIGIVGAGWLGLPLALELQTFAEIVVTATGSDKIDRLNSLGLKALQLQLPEMVQDVPEEFRSCQVLVISIPPYSRTKPESYHANQIDTFLTKIPSSCKIIYTSSTSVYPDLAELLSEEVVLTESNTGHLGIFKAERSVLSHNSQNLVVRLAGLTGYDRNLYKHFTGRKGIKNGNWPVNLVHRDDVISAIKSLLISNKSGIYNICAPIHPTKREYYTSQCKQYGVELPEFDIADVSIGKTISSEKLIIDLNYQFKFANPIDFTYL